MLFFSLEFIFGCAGSLLLRELFLVAASRGYYLAVVHRLLTAVASPVWSAGSRARERRPCGSWALEHRISSCGAQA